MEYFRFIIMNNYRLNFYIIGIEDKCLSKIDSNLIEIKRKGELWNKHAIKRYEENILKKTLYTTYEKGFRPIVDELIFFIKNTPQIFMLLKNAREISLQICIDLDDECRVPYIQFTTNQLAFLSEINCELDFHIS